MVAVLGRHNAAKEWMLAHPKRHAKHVETMRQAVGYEWTELVLVHGWDALPAGVVELVRSRIELAQGGEK